MNVRTVMLSVCPRKRQPLIEIPSEYYNGYYAYTMPVNIDEESNIIKITIPYIDDGYFGRYYVNGDYIRVDGDKLYWRGRVFKKSTVPENR